MGRLPDAGHKARRKGLAVFEEWSGLHEPVSQRGPVSVALEPTILHMDGELAAIGREGRPSFQTLQGRSRLPPGWRVSYYAFDSYL
jgi:hypothetical protein